MKYIITEEQFEKLNQEILDIDFKLFNNDWELLQKFLDRRGNPPYRLSGNLDLKYSKIKTLGNLISVGGYVNLRNSDIESLGNLISVESDLYLRNTPLSKKYSGREIREMVDVKGGIFI